MHQLLFFSIIASMIEVTTTCSIGACLTWYGSSESITLRCKVDKLKWRVTFFNQLKRAQAYCTSPLPEPKCISYSKNGSIEQNIYTNITVLKMKGHIDSKLNGEWTCEHGTNIDKAIINVTVIKEVKVDVRPRQGNCSTEIIVASSICLLVFISITVIGYFVRKKWKKRGKNQSHDRRNNTDANNREHQDYPAEQLHLTGITEDNESAV